MTLLSPLSQGTWSSLWLGAASGSPTALGLNWGSQSKNGKLSTPHSGDGNFGLLQPTRDCFLFWSPRSVTICLGPVFGAAFFGEKGVECAICFLHLSGTGTLCSISSHDLHEAFWNVVKNHHKMATLTRCWMGKTGFTWGRLEYNEPLQLRVKK